MTHNTVILISTLLSIALLGILFTIVVLIPNNRYETYKNFKKNCTKTELVVHVNGVYKPVYNCINTGEKYNDKQ